MRHPLPLPLLLVALALLAAAVALAGEMPRADQGAEPRVPAILYTPESSLDLALADAQALAKAGQDTTHYRYFSCYNRASQAERDAEWRRLSFVGNSLNFRYSQIVLPVRVDPAGRLLRLDVYALGISPKALDDLGLKGSGPASFPEAYFHEQLESADNQSETVTRTRTVTWPGGVGQDGRFYPAGYQYTETYTETVEHRGEKHQVLALARWLDPQKYLSLVSLTNTQFPIFRVDWFVAYATLTPAYLEFEGNPANLHDFYKLAGVDEEALTRLQGVQLQGISLFSEVAHRNRALLRSPTPFNRGRGFFWESFDFLQGIQTTDLLKNPLVQGVKPDAQELIFSTPSGTQAYGVVDKNGLVLQNADSRVAADRRTRFADPTIFAGMNRCSCCHASGIIPIADEVRLSARDTAAFAIADSKVAHRVADLFFSGDIQPLVYTDSANFSAVVRAATGLDASAASAELEVGMQRYLEGSLDLEEVALETGYPPAVVQKVIEEAGRLGTVDQSYVRLLRQRRARRDQHEAGVASLLQYLSQIKEGPKK